RTPGCADVFRGQLRQAQLQLGRPGKVTFWKIIAERAETLRRILKPACTIERKPERIERIGFSCLRRSVEHVLIRGDRRLKLAERFLALAGKQQRIGLTRRSWKLLRKFAQRTKRLIVFAQRTIGKRKKIERI